MENATAKLARRQAPRSVGSNRADPSDLTERDLTEEAVMMSRRSLSGIVSASKAAS
jgi:hypothetical protein